jgi:two-component system response regulator YesN
MIFCKRFNIYQQGGTTMYHVLVAEDEMWIRNGLVEMIERSRLDFKVVAQAGSGLEAWNLINEVWPNVIITDIVMPEMDGLSILRQCDEYKLPIVPIVISGFENFTYARQAIRYGASEYLLKPVVEEELLNALQRSVERLQSNAHYYKPLHQIQEFLGFLELWDHQRLVNEAVRIIKQILNMKTVNRGINIGLLRIYANKLNEHLSSLNPHFQKTELENVSDKSAIQAYFIGILEQWSRHLHSSSTGKKSRLVSKRVNDYIEQNYSQEITLTHMAEHVDLSVSRFCVLFKQEYGESFINYLNNYRMEKAKVLLLEPDLKVYEIADMVGFSSLPYFNRLFKSMNGLSPNEFRRSLGL